MIVNPSFGSGEDCKLPAGGAAGQVLTKKSAADNDAQWKDVPKPDGLLPSGGAAGQVLTKKTAADNDAQWVDAPGVPSGVIVMWSGAASAIPSGWLLCNGQNGTPDLRDRFIVGAGSSYSVGNTGGSAQVALTVGQMPSHNHTFLFEGAGGNLVSGGRIMVDPFSGGTAKSTEYSGGSQSHENRPPYYALCFIMKQ